MPIPEPPVRFAGISFPIASKFNFFRINPAPYFHLYMFSRQASLGNHLHANPHLKVTSQGLYLRHSAKKKDGGRENVGDRYTVTKKVLD